MMKKFYLLAVLMLAVSGFASAEITMMNSLENSRDCATLTLTSGFANQSVCINMPIAPLVYLVGNGGTGASVVAGSLPDGVEAIYDQVAATLTLSGTPTVSGNFNFTVTTIGGDCPASLSGTITVNPNARLWLATGSHPANGSYCVNSQILGLRYTISDGATGIFLSSGGFPPGVSGAFINGQYRITGSPTTIGAFPYTLSTSGGCSSDTRSGVINVVNEAVFEMVTEPELLVQSVCPGYMEPIVFRANANSRVELLQGNQYFNLNDIRSTYTLSSDALLAVGSYHYEIGILDGDCGNPTLSGTVTVLPSPGHVGESCQFTDNTYTTLHFDWQDAIGGATSYEYTYSVDNGPEIHGTTFPPVTELYVSGLVPGQAVHFQYYAVGPFCHQVWSSTCASAPLAVNDFTDTTLKYSPNPVEDILNITNVVSAADIAVYNFLGRQVYRQAANTQDAQIDMSDFSKGIYFIKVTTGGKTDSFKVIKK